MSAPNTTPYHLPEDAVWFVTGCSSGIGKALSQHVSATPSNRIVATARSVSSLSYLPDSAPNVLKLQLDVTSGESIQAALDAAVARFGRVDVVVNNAGYSLMGDAEGAGDGEARAVFDTNFWGTVEVTKRALGILREVNAVGGGQRGGVVLNVSSMGGYIGFPGSAFYHASKFAVEGFTEAVAKEVPGEWNIHFSLIEPGGVKTNYATTSLRMMASRHPAYADPSYPTNALLAYMLPEESRAAWAEPEDVAAAMYEVVARGERIPLRVPLGADSWGMMKEDVGKMEELLGEVRELSCGVSGREQLDSIAFLRK